MELMGRTNPEFKELLELGMSERLAIFVGAGPSIEAGLPNWDGLALRYVEEALKDDDVPPDLSTRFVDPRHLAVIADARVGEFKRFSTLTTALYQDRMPPQPGPTAKEIAKLYRARLEAGLTTFLATTNFDPLLEMALDLHVRDRMPDQVGDARSLGLEDAYPDYSDDEPGARAPGELFELLESGAEIHRPAVLHLHGGVDLRKRGHPHQIAPIILTERDYAMHGSLAQRALLELLQGLDCMLVGLSLKDNDVLSALYTMMKGKQEMEVPEPPQGSRYIVALNEIIRLRKDDPEDHSANIEAIHGLEMQRLQKAGVQPLNQLKSFAQIPQVLHEMGVAVELAAGTGNGKLSSDPYYESADHYQDRMALWKSDFERQYAASSDFDRAQRRAGRICSKALEDILKSMGARDIEDQAAIHVWARSQTHKLMMLPWFCNEFARRGGIPESLERQVEHLEFDIALRQAFEGVSSRGFRSAAEHSRWKQIMAVPIISSTTGAKHRYRRLMVGVVTLSTNLVKEDSSLSQHFKDDHAVLERCERRLRQLGVELLIDAPAGLPSVKRPPEVIGKQQHAAKP
jgi:hypothetical protein